MYVQPIQLKFLPHEVKLYKSKLISKDTSFYTLEHVRIQLTPSFYTDKGIYQQNGIGNNKLYYDMTNSRCWQMKQVDDESWEKDKIIPIEEVKFSVGDTLKFSQYPYVSKIIKIEPIWGETNDVHHYEIDLD